MAFLRVTEPFTCYRTNAYGDDYTEGQIVDSGDPAVKGREAYFTKVEATSTRRVNEVRVERATAAPGEKREVSIRSGDPARDDEDLAKRLRANSAPTDEEQGKESGDSKEPEGDPVPESGDPARNDDDLAHVLRDDNVADGTDEGQGKESGDAEDNPTQGIQTDDVNPRKPAKKAATKKAAKKS